MQAACTGHDGTHSSQPSQEEESRTCKELSGAPTSTHQCPSTLQCPVTHFPPVQNSIKVFMNAHPGHVPRAQLYMFKKHIKTLKEQLRAVQPHIKPQEGAITLLGEPRSGHLAVQGGTSASSALPITAVRPCLGPLADRAQLWQACGASDWVIRTVTKGYRLQFASTSPHFNGVVPSRAWGDRALVLKEEITTLQSKGAIQVVPPEQSQSAQFCSKVFVVFSGPKEGWGIAINIRSARSEQTHESLYVQNADTRTDTLGASGRLVYFNRLKGRLLSHPYLPPSRKISQVRLPTCGV